MNSIERMRQRIDPAQLARGRENHAAFRAQHEHDQQQARWKAEQMKNQQKAPTGVVRIDTNAASRGLEAYGDLNKVLDDALGEIDQAMKRARLAEQTTRVSDDDVRRAPVLENRRGGRI